MTAPAAAGSTTIARLACHIGLANGDPDATAVRARLDAVLERRLQDAVAHALAPLDATDPGAVWIVRRMRADARVSSVSDDLDLLARQWGGQLASAIVTTLRRGPGGEVVRFGSHAEYLAAYVAARYDGGGERWVFASLAHLDLLAPATALRTGAEGVGVRVTDVVAELARRRAVGALLALSAPGALQRLWAACLGEAAASAPSAADVERVAEVAASLGPRADGEPVAARALRLLAAAIVEPGAGATTVAAVAALVSLGDGVARDASWSRAVHDTPRSADTSDPASLPEEPSPATNGTLGPLPSEAPVDGEVFAAHGAPAFLVLPSLEAIGLGAVPAATRAQVLCRLLGCPADRAILLAAGPPSPEPSDADPDEPGGSPVLDALVSALAGDQRIDGRWLVAEAVPHPDGRRTVALLRDAVGDVWLGGAVVEPGEQPPWAALAARVEAALGRRVALVAARGGRAPHEELAFTAREAVAPAAGDAEIEELERARSRLRPAAADVAWLSPQDDDDLATGLAARAALRHLARRLLGFDRATMAYLVERFVPGGGVVALAPDAISVELAPAALAVVLTMVGLDSFAYRVAWLDREVLVTHRSG